MIVETVTTTINPDGTVNCAAMGVEWGDEEIVIKPYRSTRTLRNLEARGAAVVNLTDDILLFTQAALEDPHPPTRPAAVVDGAVLADACSWREVTVDAIDATGPRARVTTRVVGRGQRARVHRLQPGVPRGPRGLDPRLARPPAAGGRDPRRAGAPGRRRGQDGRPARAGGDGLRPGAGARRDRRRMTTVRVEAPARLHMGMLDASGDGPRRFGGLGVAVSRPAVVVEASASDELTRRRPGRRARPRRGAALPRGARPAAGARVRVLEAIPAHAGLGSGTKLALAVTAALSALAGQSPDPAAMARTAGRGARSAVGLWTFALGGFVVEGGRRPGADEPAPLLTRHAMPDEWRCVLVIPAAEPGLSGGPEEAAFADLRPDPDRSAEIAQLVLTALLPALVERDLAEFGAALSRIQRLVGDAFAPVQGGTFHPQAGPLVDALLRLGAAGAGQSSWGPAVYGLVGSEQQGHEVVRGLEAELGAGGRAEVVRFDNHGARVEVA